MGFGPQARAHTSLVTYELTSSVVAVYLKVNLLTKH